MESEIDKITRHFFGVTEIQEWVQNRTLKGALSVLKLIPGTYFNQTGNPLWKNRKKEQNEDSEEIRREEPQVTYMEKES